MIWNRRRRIIGNLIPAIPVAILLGAWAFTRDIRVMVFGGPVAIVASWLMLNLWGFYDNAAIRRELLAHLNNSMSGAVLVGFADTESPSSALDAHGDVGLLELTSDELKLRSETREIHIPLRSIAKVGYARNPHSWVGLGRWITIEARRGGKPYLLRLEPREMATMRKNRHFSTVLARRISELAQRSGKVDLPA